MTMTVVLAVIVIAVAIVVIVLFVRAATPRAAVGSSVPAIEPHASESSDAWLVPRDDVAVEPAAPAASLETADPIESVGAGPATATTVAWPQRVTGDVAELDDAARIRLLNDLGIVRAPWCVPVLLLACEEEHDPTVRRAALKALGGFRASADARLALEHAVAANDAEERAIAAAALRTFA